MSLNNEASTSAYRGVIYVKKSRRGVAYLPIISQMRYDINSNKSNNNDNNNNNNDKNNDDDGDAI